MTGSQRVVWDDPAAGAHVDVAPCGRCGKDVVLAHDEPCPHGYVCCDTCERAEVCHSCALVEIADLYAIVTRVQRLRDRWREFGMYGSPHYDRVAARTKANVLTKALEGEPGSE